MYFLKIKESKNYKNFIENIIIYYKKDFCNFSFILDLADENIYNLKKKC